MRKLVPFFLIMSLCLCLMLGVSVPTYAAEVDSTNEIVTEDSVTDDTSTTARGVYYDLYDLLSEFIYGSNVSLTSDQTLTLTLVCTLGCLFLVALPFLLVFKSISSL